MRTYASNTPESRELLSDLEYLWDQVKDIQSSSQSSENDSVSVPPPIPLLHSSTRSLDHSSANWKSPNQGNSALTAENLMTYNQQQLNLQEDPRQSHLPRRHGPPIESYTSADKSNFHKKHGSSRRSSKYLDNQLPSDLNPPPLYHAQSYISGGASNASRAAETVNTAAATGLPSNKNQFLRKQYPEPSSRSVKNKTQQTQKSHTHHSSESDVASRSEYFDSREAASNIRNAALTRSSSTNLNPIAAIPNPPETAHETNEMKRWRRDVNWALGTINEEILAIHHRYGLTPALDNSLVESSSLAQSQEQGQVKKAFNTSGLEYSGSVPENSEKSELYKTSILYAIVVKAQSLLPWIGIGAGNSNDSSHRHSSNNNHQHHNHHYSFEDSSDILIPNHRKLSGETELSTNFDNMHSSSSYYNYRNQNNRQNNIHQNHHQYYSGNNNLQGKTGTKSQNTVHSSLYSKPSSSCNLRSRSLLFILSFIFKLFSVAKRIIIDLLVLYLAATLIAKGVRRYPQLVQNSGVLRAVVYAWDGVFENLVLKNLLRNMTKNGRGGKSVK